MQDYIYSQCSIIRGLVHKGYHLDTFDSIKSLKQVCAEGAQESKSFQLKSVMVPRPACLVSMNHNEMKNTVDGKLFATMLTRPWVKYGG